jgi:hypothetical protein
MAHFRSKLEPNLSNQEHRNPNVSIEDKALHLS